MEPSTTTTTSSGEAGQPTAATLPTVEYGPQPAPALKVPWPAPRIIVACLAALFLFIGSIGLLYYTWLPRQNPNAMIVVTGDASYDGAQVTVVPVGSTGASVADTINPVNGYRLRFHVPPGLYHVVIRAHDRTLVDMMAETHGYPYLPQLLSLKPGEGPVAKDAATRPAP